MEEKSKICKDGKYRKWLKIKCSHCSKYFWREKRYCKKNKVFFCSQKCYKDSVRNKIIVECSNCGKHLERKKYVVDRNKNNIFFCSNKCRNKKSTIGKTKKIKCVKCNKYVVANIHASKIMCDKCKPKKNKKNNIDFHKVLEGLVLVKNTYRVKKFILENNLIEYRCDRCGIKDWNGTDIVLQLHHKDGNKYNNKLNNLMFLCPNCHSQTDNWGRQK